MGILKPSTTRIVAVVILLFASAAGTWRWWRPPVEASKQEVTINQILRGDYNAPGMPADQVALSDGKVISDMGYQVAFVGSLPRPGQSSLLLFRSQNCWECEAKLELKVYDPESGQILVSNFPTQHSVADTDTGAEAEDLYVRAAFGLCLDGKPSLLVASRFRQVDSDGERLRVPPEWSFETQILSLGANGVPTIIRDDKDGFEKLDSLIRPDCIEIPQQEAEL